MKPLVGFSNLCQLVETPVQLKSNHALWAMEKWEMKRPAQESGTGVSPSSDPLYSSATKVLEDFRESGLADSFNIVLTYNY